MDAEAGFDVERRLVALVRSAGPLRAALAEFACTPRVRARWAYTQQVARRVHGGRVSLSQCAEMVAAEVLSAVPIYPDVLEPDGAEAGAVVDSLHRGADDCGPQDRHRVSAGVGDPCGSGPVAHPLGVRPHSDHSDHARPGHSHPDRLRPGHPGPHYLPCADLGALLRGLEHADAFELDRRLRAAVEMERRLDAQIGPLLDLVIRHWIFRALGYPTREKFVRERLGMDPSWGRALLRIERATRVSPVFEQAYRAGTLTALQATTLVPLVLAELSESWTEAWIQRARSFSLRRLRDDVERALLVRETDWQAWLQTGGLPDRPGEEAEDGRHADEACADQVREIRAKQNAPEQTCAVAVLVDADVARLIRALVCTIRRRTEHLTGHLPTEGQAFEAMPTACGSLSVFGLARRRWRSMPPAIGCSGKPNRGPEVDCKPDSVPEGLATAPSRIIRLGPPSPTGSGTPTRTPPHRGQTGHLHRRPYLSLLREGFTSPPVTRPSRVGSYPTFSPLPLRRDGGRPCLFCGTFPGVTPGGR